MRSSGATCAGGVEHFSVKNSAERYGCNLDYLFAVIIIEVLCLYCVTAF